MLTVNHCKDIRLLEKLAAFVDGEGYIGIGKYQAPRGYFTYRQRLQIVNTDVRLIEWLIKNFGGVFPKVVSDKRESSKGRKHKDKYNWALSGSDSYKLIKNIQPYLILKQEQADNAIELYEKVSKFHYSYNNQMPLHKRKLAEDIFQRNKELNMKGKYEGEEIDVLVSLKIRKDVLDEWLE